MSNDNRHLEDIRSGEHTPPLAASPPPVTEAIKEVRRLKQGVQVGVYGLVYALIPLYVFVFRMALLHIIIIHVIGLGLAIVVIEFAFSEMLKLRQRAEEAMWESEQRIRAIVDSALDAVITIDEQDVITGWNPQAETIFGWPAEDVIGQSLSSTIIPERFREGHYNGMKRFLATGESSHLNNRVEIAALHRDGRELLVELAISAFRLKGKMSFAAYVRDITERKQAEEALREQARRDALTGTLNHAAIVEELARVIEGHSDDVSHTIAMVDIDGLKAVNDTYGHQMGDMVLLTVAQALSRDGALVGRYGGDEFVVILPGADRAAGEEYRDAVFEGLAGATLTDPETGSVVSVGASIGLAVYPAEARAIDDLIQLSDNAMYRTRRQRMMDVNALPSLLSSGADRAAELVGQLAPLLAAPGDVTSKLQLVSQRLSVGAGYDAVDVRMYPPEPGLPLANNAFADVSQDLIASWNKDERSAAETDIHPIRAVLERNPRPIILDDPWQSELLWESQRAILQAAGLKSVLVAPLLWDETVIGSLGVAAKREKAFGPSDAHFLGTVASQVTAIVRMAALVDQLEESAGSLIEAQEQTVLLLAGAAEAHDHTTGSHLETVRTLTEALASEIGEPEESVRQIGLGSVLHDIGKIRVPESVLSNPAKLVDEDWQVMKNHTIWGAEFLAGHAGFELAATIARSHHERWDGGGYPDGFCGEEIPFPVPIVTVADAFDAITCGRPYRQARSINDGVNEIVAHSGQQFSPDVVQALVTLHEKGVLTRLREPAYNRKAAA